MAFALLLSVARNIVYGDSIARDPNVTLFDINWLGSQVSKTTIGIIGMGKIGQIIAKRALGFDMKVLYHNRNQSPEIERQLGAEYRLLPDLLKESDFVVLILPLNDSSRKLIGKEQLAMMKKTAFLINVARGGIVDTEALTEALKNKTIKGAALDVTDPEPLPRDHPLLAMKDNLVLTPHLGSATFYARSLMMNLATENLENGLNGNPLKQSPILL